MPYKGEFMASITRLFDFLINIDTHLAELLQLYGVWTYCILFLVVFCETGLVVAPFLPGDSLLFIIGALGASGDVDFPIALVILTIAAISGNTLNYFIGRLIGDRVLKKRKTRLIKKEHLEKAHLFYEKHGGKAIIISRFLPVLRTFTPFAAGISKMNFIKFFSYNLISGTVWVLVFMFGGRFFGNIPLVKDNFYYVILGIFVVSLLPALITYIRTRILKSV